MIGKAKKLAKRSGCESVKVVFSVNIVDLMLPRIVELSDASLLSICFERGGKTCSTKNKLLDIANCELADEGGLLLVVDENLELAGTLYKDSEGTKFQKKRGKLILRQLKKNLLFGKDAYKGLGMCTVDLDKVASGLLSTEEEICVVMRKEIVHMDILGGTATALLNLEVYVTLLDTNDDYNDLDTLSVGSSAMSEASDYSTIGIDNGSFEYADAFSLLPPASSAPTARSVGSKPAEKEKDSAQYVQCYELYKKSLASRRKSQGQSQSQGLEQEGSEQTQIQGVPGSHNVDAELSSSLSLSLASSAVASSSKGKGRDLREMMTQQRRRQSESAEQTSEMDFESPNPLANRSTAPPPLLPTPNAASSRSKTTAAAVRDAYTETDDADYLLSSEVIEYLRGVQEIPSSSSSSSSAGDRLRMTVAQLDMRPLTDTQVKLRVLLEYKNELSYFVQDLNSRSRRVASLEAQLARQQEMEADEISRLRGSVHELEGLLRIQKSENTTLRDLMDLSDTRGEKEGSREEELQMQLKKSNERIEALSKENSRYHTELIAMTEKVIHYENLANESILLKNEEIEAAKQASRVAVNSSMRRADLEMENQELLEELISMKLKYADLCMGFDAETRRRFVAAISML